MLNSVILMGRIVKDPELRYSGTQNTPVASFTVACDRDYMKDGERPTDFIRCVAWRQTAEFIEHNFPKGSKIAITGRLQIRSYQDKSGARHEVAEVVADRAYFCEKGVKRDDTESRYPDKLADLAAAYPDSFKEFSDEEELPF